MNELQERFENAYSVLEGRIAENYGPFGSSSPISWWERNMLTGSDRTRMKMLRELRNLYAHNPTFSTGVEVAYPTEEAVGFLLSEIERASVPDSIERLMVPYKKVMKAKMTDLVWETVEEMKASDYSAVPIVDDERHVVGMLSESLITSMLVRHRALCFSDTLTFHDLEDEVLVHGKNHVENSVFMTPTTMGYVAEDMLSSWWKNGRRVDMIMVTRNGRISSPLLGILTPYDLFSETRSS